MNWTNVLAISQSGKGIPYGGQGEVRPDGGANYGFKNLKGHLDRLSEIPELSQDDALLDIIRAINEPETGLLSIGCVSGPVEDECGHRVSGYVEFAFNSDVLVSDAQNYFPIFFHFNHALARSAQMNVHFYWELMGADFFQASAAGFTMSVTINTDYLDTEESAKATWAAALRLLGEHLTTILPGPGRPLYGVSEA